MIDDFWKMLTRIPGAGVGIIDANGCVKFINEQGKAVFYGKDFDPVGKTIAELEGEQFAAERMAVIHQVLETGRPMVIKHILGGRHSETVFYPMDTQIGGLDCVLGFMRQGVILKDEPLYESVESRFIDLGPLDVLTRRELEVLALLGHGVPHKAVADQLGVSQRTVERYRSEITHKLRMRSIAEIARTVQSAGLDFDNARLTRLHRWHQADVSRFQNG